MVAKIRVMLHTLPDQLCINRLKQENAAHNIFLVRIGITRFISSQMNWATKHGVYVFGAKNPKDFILKSKDYYLGGLAEQIQCPTLVTDSNSEDNFPGQAKQLFDALRCKKDYLLFSEEDGAQEHCQEGAKLYANACIFNWMESVLNEIPE